MPMKRTVAVALCLFGMAIPVCAQRGGGHGGAGHGGAMSGGHSGFAGASHGGFSSRPAFSGTPARSFTASRFAAQRFAGSGRVTPGSFAGPSRFASGMAPRYRSTPAFTSTVRNTARPEYNRGDGGRRNGRDHRERYRSAYASGFGYGLYPGLGYPGLGWYDPYLFDDADDSGYDDATAYPANQYDQSAGNGGYDGQQPDQGPYEQGPYPAPYQGPPIPYRVQPRAAAPASAQASESNESVTLVFKDGRPTEQIHNYILSRTTLSVLDQHHQEIPVDDLDLVATQRANREAGVDFHLPQ